MTDYIAQPGAETLTGASGNDKFVFNFDQVDSSGNPSPEHDIDAGDIVDGGAGYDSLWAGNTMAEGYSENFDFRPVTFVSIEELDFNWMGMPMPGKVTFNSSQFGSGLSNNLVVKGAWGDNDITVHLDTADFDASGWTFPTPSSTTVGGVAAGTSQYGWGAYVYTGGGMFHNLQVGVTDGDTIHLIGSSADNNITGTIVADIITGGDGNDTLTGGAGNDTLDGGVGSDTAVFTGNWSDYTITSDGQPTPTFTIVDNRSGSPDGTDTVTGVENFQFANGSYNTAQLLSGDNTAPSAPTIDAWTDTTAPVVVSGANPLWRISGTAEAGSTVTLYSVTLNADGTVASRTLLATYTQGAGTTVVAGASYVVADGSGNWEFQTNLSEHGDRRIVAVATDASGNASADSLVYIQGSHHATTFSFADATALAHLSVLDGYHDWTSPATGDTLQFTTATTVVDSDFAKVRDVQNLKLTGASTVTLGATALAAGIGGSYESVEGDASSTGYGKIVTGNGATSITDANTGSTLRVETALLGGNTLTLAGSANFIVSDFVVNNSTGASTSDPAASDTFDASATTGTNTFNGGDGDDVFRGGSGADTIDGGAGNDTVDYTGVTNNITVRLQGTVAVADATGHGIPGSYVTGGGTSVTVSGGIGDLLYDVENVTGGAGNDTLSGDGAVNVLQGGLGNDNLVANRQVYINSGDVFDGGDGVDTLWAGKGMTDIDYGTDPVSRLDYTGATLQNIEQFAFNYMAMLMPGTATFSSSQFGAGLLANDLVVYGAWGDNDITVNLASGNSDFDASGWTFAGAGSTSGTSSYAWGHYTLTANKGMGVAGQEVGGNDTIHLTGSAGDNVITGSSVDDILTGNGGNDTLDGGAGSDTAVFSGNWSDYTITSDGQPTPTYTIVDNRGGSPDGTDAVTGVENFQFANGSYTAAQLLSGDTTAPAIPTIDAWTDTTAPVVVSGANPLWRISGTAEAGSTVTLYSVTLNADGTVASRTLLATYTQGAGTTVVAGASYVVADGSGNWEFQTNLNEHGDRRIVAVATDASGNASADSLVYIQGGHHATTFSFADATALAHLSVLDGYHDWTSPATGDTLQFTTATTVVDSDFAKVRDVQNLKLTGASTVTLGATALAAGIGGSYESVEGDASSIGYGKIVTGNGSTSINTNSSWTGATLRVDATALSADSTLTLSGPAAFVATGSDNGVTILGGVGNDTLTGGAGDDKLNGRAGADSLAGGAGNDVYYVDNALDTVTEAVGAGTDTVYASVNYTLGAGQEVEYLRANAGSTGLTLTGNELDNKIYGGAGNDTFSGGAGNDTLNGGAGVDALAGGTGNDVYYVDNALDTVTEASGAGTDTVYASVDYTLGAGQEIEYLRANAGSTGLTLTGNELDNRIYGGSGNDTLTGGAGNDSLTGGAGADASAGGTGDDVYYVDNALDSITEAAGDGTDRVYAAVDYALGAGQEIEYLRANAGATGLTLTGNELDNKIYGDAGDDTLNGGAGNDTLNGGVGADAAAGGTGNDIYLVDNALDTITEAAGSGVDTIYASVDYTLGAGQEIEFLRASATGLTLTGNELANRIVGGAGNDTLNGGAGNDTLTGSAGADASAGGTGNDAYYVDDALDTVTEAAGAGSDTVFAAVDYTLGAGQEIEYLRANAGSTGLTLTGNELDNKIYGGAGDDTLNGGAGNDTLNGGVGADAAAGGTGNDIYLVDNALDTITEAVGAGVDTVYASVDYTLGAGQEIEYLRASAGSTGLTLTGNGFGNKIVGGAGGDTLDGGAGFDTLTGGLGEDTFVFTSKTNGLDTISDFLSGTDVLSVSASGFGGGLSAGDTANLVTATSAAAANATGPYFIYVATGASAGTIYFDATGGSGADAVAFAKLSGAPALAAGDIQIVA